MADFFANKQHYTEMKDLGDVYKRIYEEKVQQTWRFAKIDVGSEDHDDEQWYDSDEEEEGEEENGSEKPAS